MINRYFFIFSKNVLIEIVNNQLLTTRRTYLIRIKSLLIFTSRSEFLNRYSDMSVDSFCASVVTFVDFFSIICMWCVETQHYNLLLYAF